MYAFLKIIVNSKGTIDDEARHLIGCYVEAGYKLKSCNEINMLDRLLIPPNTGFERPTIDWVKEQIGCPTLKSLCRMSIRSVMWNNHGQASIYKAIDKVPLPKYLLQYLKLEAFTKESVEIPTFAIPQQCMCCIESF